MILFDLTQGFARRATWSASAWALALALSIAPDMTQAAEFGVAYTGEIWSNQRGGIRSGTAYVDNLDATLQLDLDDVLGWSDASFYGHIFYNNSGTVSERLVGDFQGVSNIDNTAFVSVLELWVEKIYARDASVKVGLYDLNTEFDAIESAALFINSSHGMGADYSQSGENGPSTFPETSLAIRIQHALSERSQLRVAVLDAVPGDPDNDNYGGIKLDSEEGALLALELTHQLARDRIGLGTWYYTRETDQLDAVGRANNKGVYAFIDHTFDHIDWLPGQLNGFLRVGLADAHINQVARYLGTGLVLSGVLPSRPDDALGFAIASVRTSRDYREQNHLAGFEASSHETNYELTYRMQLSEPVSVQANIQYVDNPGADPSLANALLFGLRLTYSR